MRWSQWQTIETSSGHRGPALYEIRCTRAGKPLVIPRLLGPDSAGVLAIGETGQFEKRRRQFRRGVTAGQGHSEGNLIWVLCRTTPVGEFLRAAVLEFRFAVAETKAEAVSLEKERLWKYVEQFGEVPPFNSAFPGRREQLAKHRRDAR